MQFRFKRVDGEKFTWSVSYSSSMMGVLRDSSSSMACAGIEVLRCDMRYYDMTRTLVNFGAVARQPFCGWHKEVVYSVTFLLQCMNKSFQIISLQHKLQTLLTKLPRPHHF